MARNFPTRNYPYRWSSPAAGSAVVPNVPSGKILRFIVGRDPPPGREMTAEELTVLNDPFAAIILRRACLPTTLRELLAELAHHDGSPDGLPDQKSFFVAEGGQIRWSEQTAHLDRGARVVVARGRSNSFHLFVSTTTPFDDPSVFMQVLAWDSAAGAFQFYERRNGSWIWAGNSWDALEDDTRGCGPFDSHANGAMVMKELKFPWLHWHSMAQTLPSESFAPEDPLLREPIFLQRAGAEQLETIVRFGVDRWTQARLSKMLGGATLVRPDRLLRQVLTTTTVNITTSPDEFDGPDEDLIRVPLSLVFDVNALVDVIELDVDVTLTVARNRYRDAAKAIGLKVRDTRATPPFARDGDVFFAWATPEPAFEDINLLQHLVSRGLLSKRFAACLLMVDYPNPIGSKAREALMAFAPKRAAPMGAPTLETQMRDTIVEASVAAANSPAAEAAANLALPDAAWRDTFAERLQRLCEAVQAQLDTDTGLKDLMLLADSRRRAFRRRPIAEFDMTLPWADVPEKAPLLRLTTDGTVVTDE